MPIKGNEPHSDGGAEAHRRVLPSADSRTLGRQMNRGNRTDSGVGDGHITSNPGAKESIRMQYVEVGFVYKHSEVLALLGDSQSPYRSSVKSGLPA